MKDNQFSPDQYFLKEAESGHKEIYPKPNQSDLQKYYHDKYFQEGLGSYEVTYPPEELEYFENRLDRFHGIIQDHLPCKIKPRLLDIGAGEGFASAYFSRKGFEVSSLDYSSAGIKKQNPNVLQTHEVGDIFELMQNKINKSLKFDLLILQNVLEHVLSPCDLSELMKSLLSESGIALITVPNDFSLTQLTALKQERITSEFWVSPPDHLNYFNTHSIIQFLELEGWEVVDMIADFPVDWFLFHDGSNYINDKSKGKNAHFGRLSIENMLHTCPLDRVLDFYRACAALGVGRDITVVAKVKSCESSQNI